MAATPLFVALSVGSADGQLEPYNSLEPPDVVELTGHLGPPTATETGGWDLVLGDRFKRRTWQFHLCHMRILNSGRLPMDVLAAVEPYTPNFFLFGEHADQMKLIEAATPENHIVLTGYRRRGSRNILLTGVQVLPAAPPAATATQP